MATVEFYHDDLNNQGVITFKIFDTELQAASSEIPPLSRLVLSLSNGSSLETCQNLLVILMAIQSAKETEKRNAARQN